MNGVPGDGLDVVFAALGDPTRRRVLRLLAEQGPGTPTQLASELPVSRQAVSKHLSALADAGLVDVVRSGRETRYRVTPGPMAGAMSWMAEVGGRWDRRLDALREHLGQDGS